MTSSVSCAGLHNEFWSGGVPGKMTETFQDVSTVRRQFGALLFTASRLATSGVSCGRGGGKIRTFRKYQGLIPAPSQNFLTAEADDLRNLCVLIPTAVADQQRARGVRTPCVTNYYSHYKTGVSYSLSECRKDGTKVALHIAG